MSSPSPLDLLREQMKTLGIDAFLIGSEDAHQSEYVCAADTRRAFISGFTGSAGTALVLQDKAFLWTDGRYFLQAENELSPSWTLMKSGEPNVPDLQDWVVKNMTKGQKFGLDAWLVTTSSAQAMTSKFNEAGIEVVVVKKNPVDEIWTSRPAYPSFPALVHGVERSGVSHEAKITQMRDELKKHNAFALVVSMLDEVAWLLNIRGSDVEYNPVVISYAVVTLKDVFLFVDLNKVTTEVAAHLGPGVTVKSYDEIESVLASLAVVATSEGLSIWIDTAKTNYRLSLSIAGARVLSDPSPITLPKAIKNATELEGIRNAHVRDGVALTAFLHWLEQRVQSSPNTFSEYDVALKIEEFRAKMPLHVGPSFSTIAGFGPNGAIIHYKPERDTAKMLGVDSLFLLDSGAQYQDGTTDVTRTMHFGTPTEHMKTCYTAVLKGHIAMAALVIPEGTLGSRIDTVARTALWKLGLDYNHGTGHGVGAYLNVHEGPQGVGYRKRDNEVGFHSGMTISNEPGYYETGSFGIRIENIYVSQDASTPHRFGGKKYLGFESVTLVPIKTDIVDITLLDDWEIKWLNEYHANVRAELLPLMEEYFPESAHFLISNTEPIHRE